MIATINDIAKKYDLLVGTFGHAGDGNLHPSILCDRRDKQEFARVERAIDELFNRTIEMGGTLSGEQRNRDGEGEVARKGDVAGDNRILSRNAPRDRPQKTFQPVENDGYVRWTT